jgi:hypothetical protein
MGNPGLLLLNPSPSQILIMKVQIYRILLFLVVSCYSHGFAQVKIMPLGDSITKGAGDLGGYRAQLFDDLNKAGTKFQFVGCTTVNDGRQLIAAGQAYHNGYGSYRIDQIYKNLDGVASVDGGDDNMNGYWLTGGHNTYRDEVNPDFVLILAGTNDLGQNANESELESRMTDLLNWFQTNRPKAQILVGTVPPRGLDKPGNEAYNPAVVVFNSWILRTLPGLGSNFHVVDVYSLFVEGGKVKMSDSSDGIYLIDGIHPTHNGYVAMGDAWFKALQPLLPPSQN